MYAIANAGVENVLAVLLAVLWLTLWFGLPAVIACPIIAYRRGHSAAAWLLMALTWIVLMHAHYGLAVRGAQLAQTVDGINSILRYGRSFDGGYTSVSDFVVTAGGLLPLIIALFLRTTTEARASWDKRRANRAVRRGVRNRLPLPSRGHANASDERDVSG